MQIIMSENCLLLTPQCRYDAYLVGRISQAIACAEKPKDYASIDQADGVDDDEIDLNDDLSIHILIGDAHPAAKNGEKK